MKPQQCRFMAGLMAGASLLASMTAAFAATPPPKPTPRPGTLGAYAEKITLDRSALSGESDRVVLTNDNVVTLAEGGSIILGAAATKSGRKAKAPSVADSAERTRWRAAHRKQQQVIADLERRRALIEIEIHHIENQSLTGKTLARLDQARSKLGHLDSEIVRERAELARIVREARRRGAEPGWFR